MLYSSSAAYEEVASLLYEIVSIDTIEHLASVSEKGNRTFVASALASWVILRANNARKQIEYSCSGLWCSFCFRNIFSSMKK